jgi:hypothetical protein
MDISRFKDGEREREREKGNEDGDRMPLSPGVGERKE